MKITVSTTISSDVSTVWKNWIRPADIKKWNTASDDWHTKDCTVDFQIGGKFNSRMEAKDGSIGFNLIGQYTQIVFQKLIQYILEDGRKVTVEFKNLGELTQVNQTFMPDEDHPKDDQRDGWQNILNNFTKHVESKSFYR
jgi:uncharacterized protein YndB with AHSA1/START domain